MLFANFVCVLFLMVLVYGHTISKSIANEDDNDAIFDSLNDVDFKWEHKGKHDRFLHKYRREKSNDLTKTIENAKTITKTQAKGISKENVTPKKTEHVKQTNTLIKSKFGGFWRKFRIKGRQDSGEKLARRVRFDKQSTTPLNIHATAAYGRKYDSTDDNTERDRKTISKKKRKNYNQLFSEKTKREVNSHSSIKTGFAKQNKYSTRSGEEVRITPHQEYYKNTLGHFKIGTVKAFEAFSSNKDLTNSLASITTKINHLNFLYGVSQYKKKAAILTDKFKPDFSFESATEGYEYPSTAQIEALLNDIKGKAMHIIAEQNPALTDLITNSVTETTYGTDLKLTHIKNNPKDKRNVDSTEMTTTIDMNDSSMISSTEAHTLDPRSISEDAYTIAQSIESKLQKEMQNVIKMVKGKVKTNTTDNKKAKPVKAKTTKKTALKNNKNTTKKVTPKTTMPITSDLINISTFNPLLRIKRGKGSKKHGKNKKSEVNSTSPANSDDDYAMISVYEQMLAKSHEDNVMKMLSTSDVIMKKKKEIPKLSKRNSETLTDLSLKENIRKIYDDDEEMPEESIDYEGSATSTMTTSYMLTSSDDIRKKSYEGMESLQDQTTADDTSFEALSNKLAYNDYVNGYKHYLKFQKEQGEQKFSNLVKYQAHRHHNVDDIGKFILNKIPQIPMKRDKRNIFDDAVTSDDTEVTIKRDDSWFKKHFYLFIENGPPKKYHTSQRVSLKPVTETINKEATFTESVLDRPELENNIAINVGSDAESADVNLDESSNDFLPSDGPPYKTSIRRHMQTQNLKGKPHSLAQKEVSQHNMIHKLFGRKKKKKAKTKENDVKKTNELEQQNEIDILLDEELERHKRNAKKYDQKNNEPNRLSAAAVMSDTSKKADMKTKNYGYVDVNLIKPTTGVKVNDDKSKNSKIRNFFNKLHLRKKKKKNPNKTKRQNQARVQRFYPFSELKNMFRGKPNKITSTNQPISDYEVLTTHTTFKPVKYRKPLTLDEMQNMIPNITFDAPYKTSIMSGLNDEMQVLNVTESNLLKFYDSKLYTSRSHFKSKSEPMLSVTQMTLSSADDTPKTATTKYYNLTPPLSKYAMYSTGDTRASEVNIFTNDYTFTGDVTLEGIHHDINEMQRKLSIEHKPTTRPEISSLFQKKYVTPYTVTKTKGMRYLGHLNDAFNPMSIKIKAKEFFIVTTNAKRDKAANTNNTFMYNKENTKKRFDLNMNEATIAGFKSNAPLPDYFNDLLMWHGDLLSADNVHNPAWDEILKSMNNNTGVATPSMKHLQDELDNLDYMKNGVIDESKAAYILPNIITHITEGTITNSDIFNEDVDEKNELFEKSPNLLHDFKHHFSREAEEINENPSVLVEDRTLRSFNNDYTMDRSRTIKMPKCHLKYSKSTPTISSVVVAKTNKQPLQYYTTPLPMSVNEFNRFLKDNHLDVESVTSPLIELPKFVDVWSAKQSYALNKSFKPKVDSMTGKSMASSNSNKVSYNKTAKSSSLKTIVPPVVAKHKPTKLIDILARKVDLDPDNQIEYLEHLGDDLNNDYNFETDDEKKRRDKRISVFSKKDTTKANIERINLHDVISPSKDKLQRRTEITIINLDDIDKELQNENGNADFDDQTLFNVAETTQKSADMKTTRNDNEDEKSTVSEDVDNSFLKKLHRTIENEYLFKELNKLFAKTSSVTDSKEISGLEKGTAGKTLDETTTEYGAIKTSPEMKPHRVQICSQSYKYDLFYDDNDFRSLKKIGDKLNTPFSFSILNSPNYPAKGNPLNSEDDQREFDVRSERTEDLKRRYRDAKLVGEIKFNVEESTMFSSFENIEPKDITREEIPKRELNLFLPTALTVIPNYDKTITQDKPITKNRYEETTIDDVHSLSTGQMSTVTEQLLKVLTPSELGATGIELMPRPKETEQIYVESEPFKFRVSTKDDEVPSMKHGETFEHDSKGIFSVPKPNDDETINVENRVFDHKFHISTKSDEFQTSKQADTSNSPDDKEFKHLLVPQPEENYIIYTQNGAIDDKVLTQSHDIVNPEIPSFKILNDEIKLPKPDGTEAVVVESEAQNDMTNFKPGAKHSELTKLNKDQTKENDKLKSDIKLEKRDITVLPTMNHYTAKDVAALEVIVDMAKNTLHFDETDSQDTVENIYTLPVRQANKIDGATNSIQVHIAIPFDYQNNKRSVNAVRIRKVFSAKLSSPVDLEYQVHSFEQFPETTTRAEGLSPGMYLIVSNDSSSIKGQFALKPIGSTMDFSNVKARQTVNATDISKVETTSITNLAKVTLSKDFISAVNKHLVQLYQNFSNLDASKHIVKVRRADNDKHNIFSMARIKKLFGHDRVCNCKCRANKTMCKGCATSDSVISELIFEFDNLAQYMSDHCTEIQTFFWMNPTGGKRLKDAVHKIDSSLKDYYKSVKNKCKGHPCETFVTYIDKRNFAKAINEDREYIGWPMINDLSDVAGILKNATDSNICFDKTLNEKGYRLIEAFNNCILEKPLSKRAKNNDYKKKKVFKNVYSLDNVNVNIICNPESSTEFASNYVLYKNGKKNHLYDYTVDEYKGKKLSGIKKLLKRKKNKYNIISITDDSNKITTAKLFGKREAIFNQIESPLIADAGGKFWNDYIKGTMEPRIVRETKTNKLELKSEIKDNATQNIKYEPIQTTVSNNSSQSDEHLRSDYTSKANSDDVDHLSYNINELLKLFGTYADVEEMKQMYSEDPITPMAISKQRHKTKKAKTKKTIKIHTATKDGVLKNTFKETIASDGDWQFTKEITESSLVSTKKSGFNEKQTIKSNLKNEKETHPISITESTRIITPKNKPGKCENDVVKVEADICKLLGKIQNATLDYIKSIIKHHKIKHDTTKGEKKKGEKEIRRLRSPLPSDNMYSVETMTKPKPTIVILNEYYQINNEMNETENFTSPDVLDELLLTIIQHETNKLNEEWLKVDAKKLNARHTVADVKETLKHSNFSEIMNGSTTPNQVNNPSTSQKDESNSYSETEPSTSVNKVTEDSDISKVLKFESRASTYKTKVTQKGFLNRLVNKFGSIVTPGKVKERKVVTEKLHGTSLVESYATTIYENSERNNKIVNKPEQDNEAETITTTRESSTVAASQLTEIENELKTKTSQEVCDAHWKPNKLCDLRATYSHIVSLYDNLHLRDFEKHIRNVTCFKYKDAPKYFFVNFTRNRDAGATVAKKSKRWDWIRNKRSLRRHCRRKHDIHKTETNYAEYSDPNNNSDVAYGDINKDTTDYISRNTNNTIEYEEFDIYERDKYGIYRLRRKRRKRTVAKRLDHSLKNAHPKPELNEVYAMPGDSITMDCVTGDPSNLTENLKSGNIDEVFWEADGKGILKRDNVVVDGLTVSIKNVRPYNVGNYICHKGKRVQRRIRLSVITLPSFNLVVTPAYAAKTDCSYDDLNAIQYLGAEISKFACCDEHCTVTIEEPICMKDKLTGKLMMKTAIVMTLTPHPEIDCSVKCRRELHSSLAKLHASNVPVLLDIGVVLLNEGETKMFMPAKTVGKYVITHRLQGKDTRRSRDYQKMITKTTREQVSFVQSCPAGYYLVPEQQLCATCPQNTSSLDGDNICKVWPRGARCGAAVGRDHLVSARPRRYDWWWYPPCGYCVACGSLVCGCSVCAALALLVHVTSRGESKLEGRCVRPSARTRSPCPPTGPLSPSRVILARFFKPSLSSARATDSQEMKFEQWKERNIPPPLPPIDFDL